MHTYIHTHIQNIMKTPVNRNLGPGPDANKEMQRQKEKESEKEKEKEKEKSTTLSALGTAGPRGWAAPTAKVLQIINTEDESGYGDHVRKHPPNASATEKRLAHKKGESLHLHTTEENTDTATAGGLVKKYKSEYTHIPTAFMSKKLERLVHMAELTLDMRIALVELLWDSTGKSKSKSGPSLGPV